jgi:hypothetical protein
MLLLLNQNPKKWNSGVPQGSNTGPYGFLVMINDLPYYMTHKLLNLCHSNLESLMSIYADDVNHVLCHKSSETLKVICNESISIILDWCSKNKLVLNKSKTNFMQFHTVQSRFTVQKLDLQIDQTCMENSTDNVFLGLRLNENLNWTKQVDFVCRKLRSSIFMLGKFKNEVLFSVLRTVYFSHFFSHMRNNIIFWGHSSYANRVFVAKKSPQNYL